jgi:uncharacterized CHY-type Zn-finger protein
MSTGREPRVVHGEAVHGLDVDPFTRCRHYHGPSDVIALRFRCCNRWYPCFECHAACAGHPAEVWPAAERQARAVLCGACGYQLTIAEYLACRSTCPACGAGFNPGCARHRHLYFGD